jgi:hypothetical protein
MPTDAKGLLDCEQLEIPPGFTIADGIWSKTVCLGLSSTPIDPRHKVDESVFACDKPEQKGAKLLGLAMRGTFVCRTCICNAQNCLHTRHLKQVPSRGVTTAQARVDRARGFRALPAGREWFRAFDLKMQAEYASGQEYEDTWMSKWPQAKQAAIRASYAKRLQVFDRLKLMVKREPGHKLMTKSRGIQYDEDPATQALTGPPITRLQKAFCKTFDGSVRHKGITVTMASGMNSAQLGDWMTNSLLQGATTFYERDGAGWDTSINPDLAEEKCAYYEDIVGPEFAAMLRAQVVCRGAAYGSHNQYVKYTVDATTKSGHSDTTLGNSLLNAMIAVDAMVRCGVTGDVIVAGDDLLVAVHGDFDGHALAAAEQSTGIVPEWRKFYSYRDVTFISGRWLPNNGKHVFVPLLGRLLARLGWTCKHMPIKDHQKWRRTVRLGLSPVLGKHPVYGELLATLGESKGKTMVIRDFVEKARIYATSVVWASDALDVLAEQYGLTRGEMRSLVDYLRACPRGVGVLGQHPVAEVVITHDTSEIHDRPVHARARML